MFEFCGRPSKFFTKSFRFILCIFCLVEEELIYQLDLRKYIENQNFYSTSRKAKNKIKGAKIYSNFIIITSKTPEKNPLIAAGSFAFFTTFAQTLIKFLNTKICVKIFIFFLLLRENQTFTISFTLYELGLLGFSLRQCCKDSPYVDVNKAIF